MFFDSPEQISQIASATGFSIFAIPPDTKITFPKSALQISPEKGKITIDQIRDIISLCQTKQTSSFYVVINSAEAMNEQAQNAFLKLLEEPAENYHFILLVNNPSALLPTILSRGELYIMKRINSLEIQVAADEKVKEYAKKIITATPRNLSQLVNEITSDSTYKKKDNARPFVLAIISTAIEILYKSYFATNNPKLLKKLPALLKLYDNLKGNGHIKLHLIADLC